MNTHQKKHAAKQPTATKESQLTLELLQAIEQRDDISQRHIAQQMGVALGLANSYLKRCVKKGWVKVSTAPANRYLYYLTPNGFTEKARLTAEFFSTSFALFRQSGDEYSQLLGRLAEKQKSPLLFVGLSDLTEIALMRALQLDLPVLGIYQPGADRHEFFGKAVVSTLPKREELGAVVFTTMEQTADLLVVVEEELGPDLIHVPPMLHKMKYRNLLVETPIDNSLSDGHSTPSIGVED